MGWSGSLDMWVYRKGPLESLTSRTKAFRHCSGTTIAQESVARRLNSEMRSPYYNQWTYVVRMTETCELERPVSNFSWNAGITSEGQWSMRTPKDHCQVPERLVDDLCHGVWKHGVIVMANRKLSDVLSAVHARLGNDIFLIQINMLKDYSRL